MRSQFNQEVQTGASSEMLQSLATMAAEAYTRSLIIQRGQ